MPTPDLPGSFDERLGADSQWSEDFTAWTLDRPGASAKRQLQALGEVLLENTLGVGKPDAGDVIATGAMAAVETLARHPILTDPERDIPVVNVFSGELHPDAEAWLPEALDALTRGAVGIALAGGNQDLVDALLHTAFGADAASAGLRGHMLGKPWIDPAEGPPPDLSSLPLIDKDRLDQLLVWGTIQDYIQALWQAGSAWSAYAGWAGKATANAKGIQSLDPDHGCAGTRVTIRGSGFGAAPPANTSVQFPTEDGRCATARIVDGEVGGPAWSDREITVEVPARVGIGCVGFLVTDGAAPSDPMTAYTELQGAAGMVQSILGDAFGAQGVMFGQTVVDAVGRAGTLPQLPCPPCLPPARGGKVPNRFLGGPPVLHSFTVNAAGSVLVRPGDSITLAWDVEGADSLTIISRKAQSSQWPEALPPVPVAAPIPGRGSAGPFPVPWDGADDWDGEYVLSATNACSADPVTATVRVEMREPKPLVGVCDTHVHFMSHLAFAGYGIWGRPHPSDPSLTGDAGLADALPWCSGTNGHGPGGLSPSLEGFGHLTGGHDEFDGWPRHTTLAHQQAYIDWIKRAVDGGLRLAVFLAVNNELVAKRMVELYGPNLSVDDMSAVDRQLMAMRDMVTFVDDQAGGPGKGWMEIAESPADARRIVAAGKLAIVLGVEVDSLGGWAKATDLEAAAQGEGKTPAELVATMVQDLYDKGVRHLFPVHATNNSFGGVALFIRNYDAVNYVITGKSFDVEEADQRLGISYRIDEDDFEGGGIAEILGYHGLAAAEAVVGGALLGVALGGLIGGVPTSRIGAVVGAAIAAAQYPCPPKATNWSAIPGGHINAQGLTKHGTVLIEEMMRRGMLIDIDHMGHKTTEAVLTRCEQQGYPVVSGHTGYRELKYGWRPSLPNPSAQYSKATNADDFGTLNVKRLSSEVDKSPDELERIRKLGGLVSTITYQRDVRDCTCAAGRVTNDSAGSAKSFAQAFLYAHHYLHGRRVALGTDINGAGQLPGPRFGPEASAAIREEHDWKVRSNRGLPLRIDQVFAQQNGVRYSTPIADYRDHRFMDYAGTPPRAPFDDEQRDFWEAIAMWRSGTAPETADQPPTVQRPIATQNFIINLATGLRANSRADLPISIPFPKSKPWPFYNDNADEQLAAYLASHDGTDSIKSTDPSRTRSLVPKLLKVWEHWQAMEHGAVNQGTDQWTQQNFGPAGSGLYDANGNMVRHTAGRRDFDINIDGMAHYGLLPDLIQDLRNVGIQPQDIAALYRSAEDYIRVWERCEARRLL